MNRDASCSPENKRRQLPQGDLVFFSNLLVPHESAGWRDPWDSVACHIPSLHRSGAAKSNLVMLNWLEELKARKSYRDGLLRKRSSGKE
jgi:hypothetical protein